MSTGKRFLFLFSFVSFGLGFLLSVDAMGTSPEGAGGDRDASIAELPMDEPPTVVSTDPKDGDGVNYFLYQFPRPISVTFSREMDRDSVERAFSTSPALEGTFSWSENTVTFTPSSYPVTYEMTVTVGTGARGASGVPLRESVSFSYRLIIMR
ncbi:MAG: Ig-like domain-containing protein [Nitrospirae bacterium]|nr:Ig-like domain-containing protein [Nitrospirota bacterium]